MDTIDTVAIGAAFIIGSVDRQEVVLRLRYVLRKVTSSNELPTLQPGAHARDVHRQLSIPTGQILQRCLLPSGSREAA